MGKVTWGVKGSQVDDVEVEDRGADFEPYDGPVPPANSVLLCSLKWARVAEFGTGSQGLKLLLEVEEPDGPKSRYNGCQLFENLVDVDSQDWKIRQFMDAIGGTGKDWDNCVSADDGNGNETITKFGKIKADGLKLRVQTQIETYEGERRAKVRKYLPKATGEKSSKSKARNSGGDDEPPF